MGYDIHITRAEAWYDSEEHPITLEEWKACVADDPELIAKSEAVATMPGGSTLSYYSEGMAVWSRDEDVYFDHRAGRIVVKNPHDDVIEKMRSIAAKLSARVQGDEQEEY